VGWLVGCFFGLIPHSLFGLLLLIFHFSSGLFTHHPTWWCSGGGGFMDGRSTCLPTRRSRLHDGLSQRAMCTYRVLSRSKYRYILYYLPYHLTLPTTIS
jgi:hypothetical protein